MNEKIRSSFAEGFGSRKLRGGLWKTFSAGRLFPRDRILNRQNDKRVEQFCGTAVFVKPTRTLSRLRSVLRLDPAGLVVVCCAGPKPGPFCPAARSRTVAEAY